MAKKVKDKEPVFIRKIKNKAVRDKVMNTIKFPRLVILDFSDMKYNLGKAKSTSIVSIKASPEKIVKILGQKLKKRGEVKGAILLLEGGTSMRLEELSYITGSVCKRLGPETNVIWGAGINGSMGKEISVDMILAG